MHFERKILSDKSGHLEIIQYFNFAPQVRLIEALVQNRQSIELKVGSSSIKIDQMGVTIKGMMIKIEAQVQAQVTAVMTQVNGDAMTTVKGGIVMIN